MANSISLTMATGLSAKAALGIQAAGYVTLAIEAATIFALRHFSKKETEAEQAALAKKIGAVILIAGALSAGFFGVGIYAYCVASLYSTSTAIFWAVSNSVIVAGAHLAYYHYFRNILSAAELMLG